MQGTAAPIVTPFTPDGALNHEALADLATSLVEAGLDFLVPAGSTSEAPLLTAEERSAVIETVVEAVGDVPVVAGTGHPGYEATMRQTEAAAEAGADAALVVTPFYYTHDQATLEAYYRDVANGSPLPVYLYSVPKFTSVRVEPETAISLSSHENVAGMKDSSGDLASVQQIVSGTGDADFDVLVGAGSLLAPALDAGAEGGILALANIAPERVSEIYRLHEAGQDEEARAMNRELVGLNRAITAEYGVPGLKAAMAFRGFPAGQPRRPFQPLEDLPPSLRDLVEQATP